MRAAIRSMRVSMSKQSPPSYTKYGHKKTNMGVTCKSRSPDHNMCGEILKL